MKITINDYEIEIKARKPLGGKFNKKDTMDLLNLISLYASEAARQWDAEGADALAEMAQDDSDMIYKALDANGLYK